MSCVLIPRTAGAGEVVKLDDDTVRLSLKGGQADRYHLAQLDDYATLHRDQFPWAPPVRMRLAAQVSVNSPPGTWGFGWWNDPFALALGFGGGERRFPVLPNALWYFHASADNYLTFRDDLPANGLLAASFSAKRYPSWLLAPALFCAPLLLWKRAARWLRLLLRNLVSEDACQLTIDVTQWHTYEIIWEVDKCYFLLDDVEVWRTDVVPQAPLGMVIWIDNQYVALTPEGKFGYGVLPLKREVWLALKDICVDGVSVKLSETGRKFSGKGHGVDV